MSAPKVAYCVTTWYGHKLVETIQSIPKGERLLVIDTSVNDWCLARAWNYGLRRLTNEGFDVVITCNDDIVLRPDTGQLLADALLYKQWIDERPDPSRELLMVSAYNVRDLPDQGARWGTGPDYSCWAAGSKLLDVIGPFDENFKPCYFEDNDSHYRIYGSGFQALSYAPYHHYGSQTVNGGGDVSNRRSAEIAGGLFDKNAEYYRSKWGGGPGHETFNVPFGKNGVTLSAGAIWNPAVAVR